MNQLVGLDYVVECKSTHVFFETIAAFNCERAAKWYCEECQLTNPQFTYRVRTLEDDQ